MLSLHTASTLVWVAATGLHVLARFVPAVSTIRESSVRRPGGLSRGGILLVTLTSGLAAAVLILGLSHAWTTGDLHRFHPPDDALSCHSVDLCRVPEAAEPHTATPDSVELLGDLVLQGTGIRPDATVA